MRSSTLFVLLVLNRLLLDVDSLSGVRPPQHYQPAVVQTVVTIEPNTQKRRFMHMTKEQDDELKRLGDREAQLMSTKPLSTLRPTPIKKFVKRNRGGFGTSKSSKDSKEKSSIQSSMWTEQANAYASILRAEGLVCIENVLTPELADSLREYLIDLKDRSTSDVENGAILDSQERFADVLLNQNRCDLKVPIGPSPVNEALRHLLASQQTILRTLMETVYNSYGNNGSDATLYELNCFMSKSGARRQLVHADNVCVAQQDGLHPEEPIMLTCFVALQDVDETMGPTIFIPGTHNLDDHQHFFDVNGDEDTLNGKMRLLRSRKAVVGTLSKGSCILFDPRTLHCAGANFCSDPDRTRALFYFSFKNPRVDYPGCPSCGGYGIPQAELTLRQLCHELRCEGGDSNAGALRKIDVLASFP